MTGKYHKLCNTCPFGTIKLDSLQRNLNQLQEQVKEYDGALEKLSWDFNRKNFKDINDSWRFAESERKRIKARKKSI